MEVSMDRDQLPSPMRLLEILKDRFGALEAVANSSDQAGSLRTGG
jgi:hypothetical protein